MPGPERHEVKATAPPPQPVYKLRCRHLSAAVHDFRRTPAKCTPPLFVTLSDLAVVTPLIAPPLQQRQRRGREQRRGVRQVMYAKLRVTADGLKLYRTLRTSSAVEGYHLHLSRCLAAGAKSSGIHWIDAVRCEFDYVWTVRMLRGAGWFGSAKHYNLQLIDRANAAMRSASAGEAYKDWKETHVPDAAKEAVVRHGVYYAQRAVRMREAAAAARKRAAEQAAGAGGDEGEGGGAAAVPVPAPVCPLHRLSLRDLCLDDAVHDVARHCRTAVLVRRPRS